MNYRIRQGNIDINGKSIFIQTYIPLLVKPPYIPIIISHGFDGSYAEMAPYAADFANAGYLSIVFDFCGGSTISRSSGSTLDMSVRSECDDLKDVILWLNHSNEVDMTKLILIGESQGGLVSALTAINQPNWLNQLILIYPAFCISDDAHRRYPNIKNIPDKTTFWNVPLSKKYYQDIYDLSIYDLLPSYTKPVLIIHGSKDSVVDISYSIRASHTYPNASLKVIDNADHGFRGKDRDQAASIILNYLDSTKE